MLLIVEDLIRLGPIIFPFRLEGFPHKNFGALLVGCLIIILHCEFNFGC